MDPQAIGQTVDANGNPIAAPKVVSAVGDTVDADGNPVSQAGSNATDHGWLGSALDFVKGFGSQVNPATLAKGIWGAVTHPIDTVEGLADAQVNEFKKAKDFYDQGRYAEAVGHTVAGALPLIGPQAANIGESITSGDQSGAYNAGRTVGLTALSVPGAVIEGAARLGQAANVGDVAADALASAGASKTAQAISPVGTSAKLLRLQGMAQDVAGRLSTEPGLPALSRASLASAVSARLDQASDAIDAANDARNANAPIQTQPIIAAMQAERAKLVAQPVTGSRLVPEVTGQPVQIGVGQTPTGAMTTGQPRALDTGQFTESPTVVGRPIGREVIPPGRESQVAQLDDAIDSVQQLGPVARYDDLRKIRQGLDSIAKPVYSPAVTPDFLTKQGQAQGAASAAGALRESLAQADPTAAAANSEYSFWRKANDVIQSAQELENGRPAVGRALMSRLTGSVVGATAGGGLGAAVGAILAPTLESATRSVSLKLLTGRMLGLVSQTLRTGDVEGATRALQSLRRLQLPANAAAQTSTQAPALAPAFAGGGGQ